MESVKIFIPCQSSQKKLCHISFHSTMISKSENSLGITLLLLVLSIDYGISLIIPGKNISNNVNMVKIGYSDAVGPHTLLEGDIIGPMPKMGRSGIMDPTRRWPENTVVYEFDPNFSEELRTTFMKATKHITGRTCIIFKERLAENDYIFVTEGTDCRSFIGNRGGSQILSLTPQCADLASHIHHLVHVIGYGHEHNRADRDQYVVINWNNIDQSNRADFDKYPEPAYSPFSVPYDYGSIMHWGPKIKSNNGQDTIVPMQVGAIIGEAKELSDLDIKKINNMYCKGSIGMHIRSVYDWNYLDVKGGIAGEGKEVILSKLKNGNHDSQIWTANWLDLTTSSTGATFANWAQDGGRLKVLDEAEPSGIIATWGYASGYRNQRWTIQEVPFSGSSVQKRYLMKNVSTGKCLSAPTTRCVGLNLVEFFFKKLVYNNCKGGQVRSASCNPKDSKQLWNFDFV